MAIWDRFRRGRAPVTRGKGGVQVRGADSADAQHLGQWAEARKGVEGFVEPQTTVSSYTLLLVAIDGEWTRRRVPSVRWAHDFCNGLGIPSYDAAVVGVPARMREWNRRQKQTRDGPPKIY